MSNYNNITDADQERMCKLCEESIIEGSGNSSTYQCEGRHCEGGYDLLVEEKEQSMNPIIYKLNSIFKYLWTLKTRNKNYS